MGQGRHQRPIARQPRHRRCKPPFTDGLLPVYVGRALRRRGSAFRMRAACWEFGSGTPSSKRFALVSRCCARRTSVVTPKGYMPRSMLPMVLAWTPTSSARHSCVRFARTGSAPVAPAARQCCAVVSASCRVIQLRRAIRPKSNRAPGAGG